MGNVFVFTIPLLSSCFFVILTQIDKVKSQYERRIRELVAMLPPSMNADIVTDLTLDDDDEDERNDNNDNDNDVADTETVQPLTVDNVATYATVVANTAYDIVDDDDDDGNKSDGSHVSSVSHESHASHASNGSQYRRAFDFGATPASFLITDEVQDLNHVLSPVPEQQPTAAAAATVDVDAMPHLGLESDSLAGRRRHSECSNNSQTSKRSHDRGMSYDNNERPEKRSK